MSSPRVTAAADGPSTPPPGRYRRGRDGGSAVSGKLIAVLLGALFVALLVVGGTGLYRYATSPTISGQQSGFVVVDDRTIDITVDVTRDRPEQEVFCIIRAKDAAGAEVARREVFVPASSDGTTRLVTRLVTTGPPVAGDVYGCGADIPDYLRR